MLHKIEDCIKDIASGRMLILVDDEHRENEGDLVIAADLITPSAINFMAKYGRGLICLSMAPHHIDRLQLPMMTTRNESAYGTAFTISVEAREGVSTGISAQDRAHTIRVASSPKSTARDLISPGHIFPLRANVNGVLGRPGQTEGSVDLARLAGLTEAAVICEIMNDDGSMARLSDLKKFSKKHDIKILSIQDIIHYRVKTETLITNEAKAKLPNEFCTNSVIHGFRNTIDQSEHIAVVFGNINSKLARTKPPLVRIHSECLTGDVFKSKRCDCGKQLELSMQMLAQEQLGILIYLKQHEGRGIGLLNKVKAYELQDSGMDTVEANEHLGFEPDLRHYGNAFQILKNLGISEIRLLTNNPAKISGLESFGINIVERISIECDPVDTNIKYLNTKKLKLGHFLRNHL